MCTPSRSTKPVLSGCRARIASEQLGDPRRGEGSAVGLDRDVLDVAPDLLFDGCRDHLWRRGVEVHAAPCPVAVQAVADVEVLLEVMAQREVEERPAVGRQL